MTTGSPAPSLSTTVKSPLGARPSSSATRSWSECRSVVRSSTRGGAVAAPACQHYEDENNGPDHGREALGRRGTGYRHEINRLRFRGIDAPGAGHLGLDSPFGPGGIDAVLDP